jgi:hypothetical protein
MRAMSATKLKKTIEALANEFADELLRALGNASFSELSAELHGAGGVRAAPGRAGGGGRRARRSESDLDETIDRIVSTLKSAGAGGLRSEELRRQVGLARAEMMRPIALALSTKKIRKTGEKRATTYFAR